MENRQMEFLECGRIVNTHGVRGELKLDPWCDGDSFFSMVDVLYLDGAEYNILGHRPHKNFVLLRLSGVSDMATADALKGKVASVSRSAVRLPEGTLFLQDLYGFSVYDRRAGRVIGTLSEVLNAPGGTIYEVSDGAREILIPGVDAFIKSVDREKKQIIVETIEGMLPNED